MEIKVIDIKYEEWQSTIFTNTVVVNYPVPIYSYTYANDSLI